MYPQLTDDPSIELSASANQVGAAWVLAAVVVTLLMTVVAPLLIA